MVYQEVGCNKPCLERKSIRKETNSIDKKGKEKHQEDSVASWNLRRNEKELEKVDDRPTPVAESHNSEDDSDELPRCQSVENQLHQLSVLFRTTPSSHWKYNWKALTILTLKSDRNKIKNEPTTYPSFWSSMVWIRHKLLTVTTVEWTQTNNEQIIG